MLNKYFYLTLFLSSTFLSAQQGMDIFYLFDVSGSYHQEILDDAVDFSEDLFSELSNVDKPIYPQKHQLNVIDEYGLTGEPCRDVISQGFTNVFITPSKKKSSRFKSKCLADILKNNPAKNTDMYGAILWAQDSLEDSPAKRKALLIFSDFKDNPAQYFEENINSIDLSNIAVVLFWSDTYVKQHGAQSKKLANEFKKFLLDRNAKTVKVYSLNSVLGDSFAIKNLTKELIDISKK